MEDKKKQLTFYLPERTIRALDIWKRQTGLSRNQIIGIAISNYLCSKPEFLAIPEAKELLKEVDI